MYQLPQTAIELPCTTDYTSCRVQHSLQLVGDDFWSPSEDNVTVWCSMVLTVHEEAVISAGCPSRLNQ